MRREFWKLERLGLVGEKWLSGLELENQEPIRRKKKGVGMFERTRVLKLLETWGVAGVLGAGVLEPNLAL